MDRPCRDCGELLTPDNSQMKSISKKGRQYYLNRCKTCISDSDILLRKLKKENSMPPSGTPCELCNRIDRLFCDHDHSTKKWRGWICRNCNAGLGFLGDSEEGLRRAQEYLARSVERSRSPPSIKNDNTTDTSSTTVDMALGRTDNEQLKGSEELSSNRSQ